MGGDNILIGVSAVHGVIYDQAFLLRYFVSSDDSLKFTALAWKHGSKDEREMAVVVVHYADFLSNLANSNIYSRIKPFGGLSIIWTGAKTSWLGSLKFE